MKLRIAIIVPLLLGLTAIGSSMVVYVSSTNSAEENIRQEVILRVNLDITRLQNVLYNILTERGNSFVDARLNLSVTAMDPLIKTLVVTDVNNKIILANRTALEDNNASDVIKKFDQSIAQKIKSQNTPNVSFLKDRNHLLHGYYPVVLKLESIEGMPEKQVGILFVEANIKQKLAVAYQEAAKQSFNFAAVMLIATILLAALLHRLISQRLIHLSSASEQLASGELDARANLKGNDELSLLGQAFDKMAEQIKKDITLREQAEEDLRKLTETLEQNVIERTKLLNEAQSIGRLGNWSWNLTTNDIYWSDEIYKIYGYQPNEIKPDYNLFISTFHPDDFDKVKTSGDASITTGGRYSIDHRITLPNGDERWVHEEIVAEEIIDGEPVVLSGTIQDITERKLFENDLLAAKEEAERLSEAKSDFLSRMSHELRTPMNAILGFSQLLNMDSITDRQRNYVHEISTAGTHLLELITDLLDLGRIEAGTTLVVLENIRLKNVVDEAVKLTEQLRKEYELSLDVDECLQNYNVIADTTRLRQVLVNLLSNAAKYNTRGASIEISCREQNDMLKLMVTDKGKGIAPDLVDKLFMPFERLGAEKSGIDGTGIGLSLSRQLMELMQGNIGVESQPDKGATFWIEIPLTKSSAHSNDEFVDSEMHRTILYIEDNLANMRVVEGMLSHFEDLKLLTAYNGKYGIELTKEYKPDLVLLDINLPDIDGYQVLKALRENSLTKEIPVVALSSNTMPLDIERGMKAGLDDYLTKPVKLEELIAVIKRFCDSKPGKSKNQSEN